MGLDLYIEALIKEKKTGRVISNPYKDGYNCGTCLNGYTYKIKEENGFFEVCSWHTDDFYDIMHKMIDICNRHMNTNYTDEDDEIPIPHSALRDIYAFLVKRSYLPDDEEFEVLPCNIEWERRSSYEKMNLINADKISGIIYQLKCIEYYNDVITSSYIPNPEDKKAFENNPQNYEWKFRIIPSY
ncbi:MAG: hypothetical protein NC205_07805 [Prevotella sp.]|nr:hypothetical protein [Alistipes senegalensis]MCM1358485.1 hypothetical protein [Prevotella sp.]MCM1474044.1 hypothetical protein [Muribaculaceae bacterium]